jgi:hypothetical protein
MTSTSKLHRRILFSFLIVTFAGALPGCVAATGAAVGAGSAIYLTTRGAESVVNGSIDNVEKRARAVFASEGIPVTGADVESSGAKRTLKGSKGDLEISVSMEQQGGQTTKTEVSARKNVAEWDREYAQRLLNMIIKHK